MCSEWGCLPGEGRAGPGRAAAAAGHSRVCQGVCRQAQIGQEVQGLLQAFPVQCSNAPCVLQYTFGVAQRPILCTVCDMQEEAELRLIKLRESLAEVRLGVRSGFRVWCRLV